MYLVGFTIEILEVTFYTIARVTGLIPKAYSCPAQASFFKLYFGNVTFKFKNKIQFSPWQCFPNFYGSRTPFVFEK